MDGLFETAFTKHFLDRKAKGSDPPIGDPPSPFSPQPDGVLETPATVAYNAASDTKASSAKHKDTDIGASDCTSSMSYSSSADEDLTKPQPPLTLMASKFAIENPTSIMSVPPNPALTSTMSASLVTGSVPPSTPSAKLRILHPCPICGKKFDRRSNLNKHVRCVHQKIKPYHCTICDSRFGQKSSLEKHVAVIHEKRKRFQCSVCNTAFGQIGDLHVHTRTVHLKQRPYNCDNCDLTFGLRSHLNKHRRVVHENIRPYMCPTCGMNFGERHDLRKHERLHEKRHFALPTLLPHE